MQSPVASLCCLQRGLQSTEMRTHYLNHCLGTAEGWQLSRGEVPARRNHAGSREDQGEEPVPIGYPQKDWTWPWPCRCPFPLCTPGINPIHPLLCPRVLPPLPHHPVPSSCSSLPCRGGREGWEGVLPLRPREMGPNTAWAHPEPCCWIRP